MKPSEVVVANALLRCTRGDEKAAPLFESVRSDLGLWVLELPELDDHLWDDAVPILTDFLVKNLTLLKELSENSEDYTLHVSLLSAGSHHPVLISPTLSGLLFEIGCRLEFYIDMPSID